MGVVFFFKQKTAYEMRIRDWSSDVCSSDLPDGVPRPAAGRHVLRRRDRPVTALRLYRRAGAVPVTIDGHGLLLKEWIMTDDHGAPPRSGWARLVPELHVRDPEQSLEFWCGLLGFRIAYQRADEGFTRSEEHPSELQSLI